MHASQAVLLIRDVNQLEKALDTIRLLATVKQICTKLDIMTRMRE